MLIFREKPSRTRPPYSPSFSVLYFVEREFLIKRLVARRACHLGAAQLFIKLGANKVLHMCTCSKRGSLWSGQDLSGAWRPGSEPSKIKSFNKQSNHFICPSQVRECLKGHLIQASIHFYCRAGRKIL